MKLLKRSQHFLICLTAKEIVSLLMHHNVKKIVDIGSKYPKDEAEKIVTEMAKEDTKERDEHEFWTMIFGLYQDFENNCEFCFQLKDSFDPRITPITTFEELVLAKTDPPDVIVLYNKKYYDFELKRYLEKSVDKESVLKFLETKVFRCTEPYNFYIILQPKSQSVISYNSFQDVFNELKTKYPSINQRRIGFSLNENNEFVTTIWVYPKFEISKYPFVSGSKQMNDILAK